MDKEGVQAIGLLFSRNKVVLGGCEDWYPFFEMDFVTVVDIVKELLVIAVEIELIGSWSVWEIHLKEAYSPRIVGAGKVDSVIKNSGVLEVIVLQIIFAIEGNIRGNVGWIICCGECQGRQRERQKG